MEEKKQKWIVRRYLGGMPATLIAAHLQISVRTVQRTMKTYKKFGTTLTQKNAGRPKITINERCKERVNAEWQHYQCGSVKLHQLLKSKGFGVSQRKIQQVLDEYKLTAPCPKRRGQRKYCSYRWPQGYFVLHTDWSICPVTGKQIIAYIDDHSRFIVGYGLYNNATAENVIHCLYRVIFTYGIPYAIITDRGACFYANKLDKNKEAKCKFQEELELLGIRHIVARAHHPQTNGKIERWFGTYKREFNERFKDMEEYVKYYNYERPHARIAYQKPIEVFMKSIGATNNVIAATSDDIK
jgi:putative transposase